MLNKIINVLLGYAVLIAGITLYGRISAYLAGGACPVPLQRPYLYSGIGAAALAFVLMFIAERKNKAQNKSD